MLSALCSGVPGSRVAGVSLVIQQAVNANLRSALQSSPWVAFTSYAVGWVCIVLLIVALRDPVPALSLAARAPWWAWFGGALGSVYIALGIFLVPHIGAATFFTLVIAGQMLASVAFDQFRLAWASPSARSTPPG